MSCSSRSGWPAGYAARRPTASPPPRPGTVSTASCTRSCLRRSRPRSGWRSTPACRRATALGRRCWRWRRCAGSAAGWAMAPSTRPSRRRRRWAAA
eukprot:scaffold10124_cov57-Phaeocystis_antarctica.AAC.3